jgi:hypothetical protein
MLSNFENVLAADNSLNSKHVPHHIRWIKNCYTFNRLQPTLGRSLGG